MKVIDRTPLIRKYPGFFVALTKDRKTVVGKGHTPDEAIEEAHQKGCQKPLLVKIPKENRSYLL